jgi:hypothetical protein
MKTKRRMSRASGSWGSISPEGGTASKGFEFRIANSSHPPQPSYSEEQGSGPRGPYNPQCTSVLKVDGPRIFSGSMARAQEPPKSTRAGCCGARCPLGVTLPASTAVSLSAPVSNELQTRLSQRCFSAWRGGRSTQADAASRLGQSTWHDEPGAWRAGDEGLGLASRIRAFWQSRL